ncbi:hypothetical protein Sbs19_27850 [Sphingobium sp. BS19]|nr:hypothetical protein Sbs19_27850 [Sphingobium sp. BS19]
MATVDAFVPPKPTFAVPTIVAIIAAGIIVPICRVGTIIVVISIHRGLAHARIALLCTTPKRSNNRYGGYGKDAHSKLPRYK